MGISVAPGGHLGAVEVGSTAELGHDVSEIEVDEADVAEQAAHELSFSRARFRDVAEWEFGPERLKFSADVSAVANAKIYCSMRRRAMKGWLVELGRGARRGHRRLVVDRLGRAISPSAVDRPGVDGGAL